LREITSRIYTSLQLLSEIMPMESPPQPMMKDKPAEQHVPRKIDSGISPSQASQEHIARLRSGSNSSQRAPQEILERTLTNGSTATFNAGSKKVEKFFGEVPAPLVQQQANEEVPDFLRLDHEGEIMYDTKNNPPQLRGGTIDGLVEQLTRHDRLDSGFNGTFLLTYRSFTSAKELFEMLVKRWSIQPPAGITQDDYQTWVDKKQKPIQFRVVNILKSWLDTYWMEEPGEESTGLIMRMLGFAKDFVATTNTPGAAPLISTIEKRMKGIEAPAKTLVLTLNQSTPPPILPKNMRKLKFLDIDSTEFARQLTAIESRLYGKIKLVECLNKTWQRKLQPGEPDPAANIKALILHSNQLTNWVAQMILNQADVKRRVIVIKHFVSVADKCRQLSNFSTLTSIISALGTAPIHRLSRTWQQVNGKTKDTLESMRKLMGSTKNFAEYRDTLHKAVPPCVPFLGVYLTDLTFIEDGIPSIIKKTTLINFAKRAKTAEVIRDIQQYQNVPYPLQPVPELAEYILSNMRTAGDVHEMYEMSLQVEPREREDEKIAR
jgi:son of sevenless-like protein